MKTHNYFLHLLRPVLLGALAAGFAACTSDLLEIEGGKLPPSNPGEATGALYSTRSSALETTIQVYANEDATEKFVYRLTAPATEAVTVTCEVLDWDLPTCEAWNMANGFDKYPRNSQTSEYYLRQDYDKEIYPIHAENYLIPYPVALLTHPNTITLTIAAGATESATFSLELLTADLPLNYIGYALPIKVTSVTGVTPTVAEQQLVVGFHYFPDPPTNPGWPDIDISTLERNPITTIIGYLDVSKYKPTLATCFFTTYSVMGPWFEPISDDAYRCYEIINLVKAEVRFDKASNRAILTPSNDLKYVLTHQKRMIDPLRKFGIKVCIALQGGRTGLGFCNMSDAQITDFVAQIKAFCSQHKLDGVNLWDKDFSYGREGMAAVNTTSYPKLIKALRDALGADKTITLADDGTATASFHDATACGGIEVGKLIDYAHESRSYTLTNPWDAAADRKAFAGLKQEQYGTFFRAERASVPGGNEEQLWDTAKSFANATGLTKVVATDVSAFLHGAEQEWGRMFMWYSQCFTFFNEEDYSGTSYMMTTTESLAWGQYSNNYYYKDWD